MNKQFKVMTCPACSVVIYGTALLDIDPESDIDFTPGSKTYVADLIVKSVRISHDCTKTNLR